MKPIEVSSMKSLLVSGRIIIPSKSQNKSGKTAKVLLVILRSKCLLKTSITGSI